MNPLAERNAGKILARILESAPLALDRSPGNWPPEELVGALHGAEWTNVPVDVLTNTLLVTGLRKRENHRIAELESRIRTVLPANVLDQIDFNVAGNLVAQDEYLRWVIGLVGGWLHINDGNCHCFSHAIRHMPEGGAVIEIGSFLGVSVCALSYLLTRHGRSNPLFNADPWHFEGTEKPIGGFFDAASKEYRDYCVATYKNNVKLFAARKMPTTVEAFSDDFFKLWDEGAYTKDVFGNPKKLGGPISFAYIDGAHTYEAAKRDFENVARHLMPGGFVLFDDSNPSLSFGCVQSAAEACRTKGFTRVFGQVNGINVLLRKDSA